MTAAGSDLRRAADLRRIELEQQRPTRAEAVAGLTDTEQAGTELIDWMEHSRLLQAARPAPVRAAGGSAIDAARRVVRQAAEERDALIRLDPADQAVPGLVAAAVARDARHRARLAAVGEQAIRLAAAAGPDQDDTVDDIVVELRLAADLLRIEWERPAPAPAAAEAGSALAEAERAARELIAWVEQSGLAEPVRPGRLRAAAGLVLDWAADALDQILAAGEARQQLGPADAGPAGLLRDLADRLSAALVSDQPADARRPASLIALVGAVGGRTAPPATPRRV